MQSLQSVRPGERVEVSDWAAFNSRQRQGASKLLASQPTTSTLACLLTLQVSVAMLRVVENVASDKWEKSILLKSIGQGTPATCRMWEAYSGRIHSSMSAKATALLNDPGQNGALPRQSKTIGACGLIFAMVSATLCSLEYMILSQFRTFPYGLWQLVYTPTREVAIAILAVPKCLLDAFSRRFLEIFNTVEKLLSKTCRAILIVVGRLARWEILRIECRHASVRRILRGKSTTTRANLEDLAARFLLQRERIASSYFGQSGMPPRNKKVGVARLVRRGKFKGSRAGGGGAQRAAFRPYLVGQKMPTKEAREAVFREANRLATLDRQDIGSERCQAARLLGRTSTLARKRGGTSFPIPPSKRRRFACDALAPVVGSAASASLVSSVVAFHQAGQQLAVQSRLAQTIPPKEERDNNVAIVSWSATKMTQECRRTAFTIRLKSVSL